MIGRVRATLAANGVTVSWDHDESGPPESFEIQSQPDGGAWTNLAVVPYEPGKVTYSYLHETPVGAGIRYQVRAVNEAGASVWAESNRVVLVPVPNAPTNVQAVT